MSKKEQDAQVTKPLIDKHMVLGVGGGGAQLLFQ